MNHITAAGRWIGAGMLLSFGFGLYSNFKLQPDLFAGAGWLVNAAQHPYRIGAIALIGLGTGLVSLAVASLLSAHFRQRHPVLTRFYFGLVVAALAVSLIECSILVAFRHLSESYVAAGALADAFQPAKAALSGLRNSVHFLDVLIGGLGVLVLFVFLFKAQLVPRLLAGFGIAAALIQMYTVARPLFGLPVLYPLLMPLALAYLSVLCWLLAKGFPPQPQR